MKNLLLSLIAAFLLIGCASNNPNDPYESFNRPMFTVNNKVDHAVFKPTAEAYRYITPKPIRRAIGNFFDNFRDLYSAGNNALSLKPKESLNDIMRVAMNSTFGIGGLIDVASLMRLKSNKTTFGDALANWGWKKSNYLVLPLLGPSTVRDSIGTVASLVASPESLIYHNMTQKLIGTTVGIINSRERLLDLSNTVDQAALDEYSYTRDGFMQIRNKQVGIMPKIKPIDDFDIDTLVSPSSTQDTTAEKNKLPDNKPTKNSNSSAPTNSIKPSLGE